MDPASIFRIGTSGYSFPDWVGPFYPPGTRRQEMFAQYVRQFRTVELNYTFYRMPAARTLERLAQASPPDFLFWVKANQRTTHEHDRTAAAEFLANLEPLRAGSRLAGVLMQFPQNFHRTVANRQVLRDTVEDFKAVPLAVEFRHGSWDHPATYEGLRERGLTLVVPDVPPLGDLFHPEAIATSRIGYLRLHSRSAAQWYAGAVQRYDYDYSDAELAAIWGGVEPAGRGGGLHLRVLQQLPSWPGGQERPAVHGNRVRSAGEHSASFMSLPVGQQVRTHELSLAKKVSYSAFRGS